MGTWDDKVCCDVFCVGHFAVSPTVLIVIHTPAPDVLGAVCRVTDSRPLTVGRGGSDCQLCCDNTVSGLHCVVHRENQRTFVADRGSTNGLFVNGTRVESVELRTGDRLGVGGCVLKCLAGANQESDILRELARLATHDGLTDLPNGRSFLSRLGDHSSGALVVRMPLSVVTVDVRNVEEMAADFGPQEGNFVLTELARHVRACAETDCTVARLTDTRFGVLVPGSDRRAAQLATNLTKHGRLTSSEGEDTDVAIAVDVVSCSTPGAAQAFLARMQERVNAVPLRAVIAAPSAGTVPFACALQHSLGGRWLLATPSALGPSDRDGGPIPLRASDCLALVLSRQWLTSPLAELEIEHMLLREASIGSPVIIPVTMDRYVFEDWQPSKPETKRALLEREVFDYTDPQVSHSYFTRLTERLRCAAVRNARQE